MPLRWKTIPVPFGQGLAQEAVPSLLAPGKLAQAENATIDKLGSVEGRPGFQKLPSDVFYDPAPLWTTSLSAVHRLLGHGYETLVSDNSRLYSYSEGEEQWRDVDYVYEATVAEVVQGERGRDTVNAMGDVTYCNGYWVHAWYESGQQKTFVRFVDAKTGTRFPALALDDEATTEEFVRVVAAGTLVHVFFWASSISDLVCYTFDTTDLETAYNTATSTYPVSGFAATRIFDAYSDGNKVYLAYNYSSGPTNYIRTVKMDLDLSNQVATLMTCSSTRCIACTGKLGQYVWVGYTAASGSVPDGLCYFVLNESSMAVRLTPTQIDPDIYDGVTATPHLGAVSTGTDCLFVWDMRNNTGAALRAPFLKARWVDTAGNLNDGNLTWRVGILSKPILYDGEPYVVGYYHDRAHEPVSQHECPGYPNRYAYLLHVQTGTCTVLEQ